MSRYISGVPDSAIAERADHGGFQLPGRPVAYRFGVYEVDVEARELRRRGLRVPLQQQPFQVLLVLLERAGQPVSRDDLRRCLWSSETFVAFDLGLNTAVRKLRQALGDSAENPRFVETLARRGYRFLAPVEVLRASPDVGQAPRLDAAPEMAPELRPAVLPAMHTFAPAVPASSGVSRRKVAAVLLLLLAVLGSAAMLVARWRRSAAAAPIRSLAVLPFANLSRDPELEYLAEGVTEALTAELANVESLRVISRVSSMRYKGATKPLPEIARELNVDGVVEGAVLVAGDRLRISAQLVHAPTDTHLWSEVYQRPLHDLLQVQGEVARSIAERVQLDLRPVTPGWSARAKVLLDPDTYRTYLRANYYLNQANRASTERAMALFFSILERYPESAMVHASLAECYVFAPDRGEDPSGTMAAAKRAAERALELDPALARAHTALGVVRTYLDHDWKGAEESFLKALSLRPRQVEAVYRYSQLLTALGRFDEALVLARRAENLDPVSVGMSLNVARVLFFARRQSEAVAQFERTFELEPNHASGHFFMALALEQAGRLEDAREHLARSKVLKQPDHADAAPRDPAATYQSLLAKVAAHQETEAERTGVVTTTSLALLHARLGNRDRAFHWLQKACESNTRDIIYLSVDPQYDSLREDPRFTALARRVGLPLPKFASSPSP